MRTALPLAAALLLAGCYADSGTPAEQADEVEPAPALALTGRVVDEAGILRPEAEDQLTRRLAGIESETGVQFVIATTTSLGGADVATYTRDLGNAWGIGDAQRNDGLMLLVAPNERKARIEVGEGLTQAITNQEAQAIMDFDILPEFSRGDYESGVARAVESLATEISSPAKEPAR